MAIKKIKLPDNTTEDINDSRLPAVTTTDNGKVLSVSGGIWSANDKPSYTLDEVTDGNTRSLANYQPADEDLTAIAGLSGTSGLLKKTAANTWSLDTNTYYYSGNSNKSNVDWTCNILSCNNSVSFPGKVVKKAITAAGWYRVLDISAGTNYLGRPVILYVRTNYGTTPPAAYIFAITATAEAATITQLSGSQYLSSLSVTKVRVIKSSNSAFYVDVYFASTNDEIYISSIGVGYVVTPSAAPTGGTEIGSIDVGTVGMVIHRGLSVVGNITATGTITPGSDSRIKGDQRDIDKQTAMETIGRLTPKTWTWNELTDSAGKKAAGLVAQEVAEIIPEAVLVGKGCGFSDFHSLNYNTIQGYEIAAIKGLIEEVKSLKAEIAELKKQIK